MHHLDLFRDTGQHRPAERINRNDVRCRKCQGGIGVAAVDRINPLGVNGFDSLARLLVDFLR